MKDFFKLFSLIIFLSIGSFHLKAAEKAEYLKTDWNFKGIFGKFDR